MLPGSAADDDMLAVDAARLLGVNNLPQAVADAAQSGDVERHQVVQIPLHPQPGDNRFRVRVGQRRPVT